MDQVKWIAKCRTQIPRLTQRWEEITNVLILSVLSMFFLFALSFSQSFTSFCNLAVAGSGDDDNDFSQRKWSVIRTSLRT